MYNLGLKRKVREVEKNVPFGHTLALNELFDLSQVSDCKTNYHSLTYHYSYSFHPNTANFG